MEAKKHPALLATLVVLGLVALTGAALTVFELNKFSDTDKKLRASEAEVRRLLADESVALTAANVEQAKGTLEKFRVAETQHLAEIAGSSASRFEVEFKGDPGELGSEIKAFVERWQGELKKAGVSVVSLTPGGDPAFGFSRYYQTGVNPQKSLQGVYRQTRVIEYLLKTLLDAKLKEEIRLFGVQREPVELAGVSGVSTNKDEMKPVADSAIRQGGMFRAESFRIRFLARTEVARRFINAVTDSHRPLCVRGVEVTVPTKEELQSADAPAAAGVAALPTGFFAEAPAAPADPAKPADAVAPLVAKPEVVVEAAPSVFTVTFAYVEAVKSETPAPANP